MIDLLKDFFASANARVRSPILGSITIAFVATNWKELFYIFAADRPVRARILYFEANTNSWDLIWFPLIVGTALAIGFPWLRLAGAALARLPSRLLSHMQSDEDHAKEIRRLVNATKLESAKAAFEEEEENRKISAAKRLKTAVEVSPKLAGELEAERRDPMKDSVNEIDGNIISGDEIRSFAEETSATEKLLIASLAKSNDGRCILFAEGVQLDDKFDGHAEIRFSDGSDSIKIGSHRRDKLAYEQALKNLTDRGYLDTEFDSELNTHEYVITWAGYRLKDEIDDLIPF